MEALLHDWLNHWTLVTDLTSSHSLLPRGLGSGTKSSPTISPHPWVGSKSHFPWEFSGFEDKKLSIIPLFLSLRKFQEFWKVVNQKLWVKIKYIWEIYILVIQMTYIVFLLFMYWPCCGLWNLSSLTRDWTQALGSEKRCMLSCSVVSDSLQPHGL